MTTPGMTTHDVPMVDDVSMSDNSDNEAPQSGSPMAVDYDANNVAPQPPLVTPPPPPVAAVAAAAGSHRATPDDDSLSSEQMLQYGSFLNDRSVDKAALSAAADELGKGADDDILSKKKH